MRIETEIKKSGMPVAPVKARGRLRQFILRPMYCAVCASIGIFGGLASLFIGLVCVLIHAVFAGDRAFDRVGTILLIVAIPMILIGAIFLDEIKGR